MAPFLKTSLELRNQIYEYLLSTKYTKIDFLDEEPGYIPGWPSRARRVYHFHPAILAVNRQINREAGQILRENLFVKFTTNTTEYWIDLQADGLPVVAEDNSTSRVSYCATELTLLYGRETFGHHSSILMFAGDDMTTFCRVLLRTRLFADPQISLSIAVTGVAPTTTSISKLLEPFRRLRSMASVIITGQIEVKYKADLITEMLRQAPEIDTFVQEIQDTIEQGDQAAINKDYCTAVAKYTRALEDNEDCIRIYDTSEVKTSEVTLKSGKYNGLSFHTAFVATLLALNIKLAITYLNRQNHSRAHQWISLALEQIEPYRQLAGTPPGGAGYARICSIAARASEGLGLVERAVEDMKEAVWHDPGDSELTTELVRLCSKMPGGNGPLTWF